MRGPVAVEGGGRIRREGIAQGRRRRRMKQEEGKHGMAESGTLQDVDVGKKRKDINARVGNLGVGGGGGGGGAD